MTMYTFLCIYMKLLHFSLFNGLSDFCFVRVSHNKKLNDIIKTTTKGNDDRMELHICLYYGLNQCRCKNYVMTAVSFLSHKILQQYFNKYLIKLKVVLEIIFK